MTMLQATTRLTHARGAHAMGRFAADHPEYVTGGASGPWRMDLQACGLAVSPEGDRLEVSAYGATQTGLSYMKLVFIDHIREYLDEQVEVDWAGDGLSHGLPPFFREARVTESRRVTPTMQRLRFAVPNLASLSVDEIHVRLLLPPEDRPADLPPVWPVLTPSGALSWPQGPEALLVRIYTLSSVDLARGEVEIDFVLHSHAPAKGRSAAQWAETCRPGAVVGLLGPGGGHLPPTRRMLLIGDETALPAIARIQQSLPKDTGCETLIEVDGPESEQPMPRPVRWLHRNGAPAGSTRLLIDAMAELTPSEDLYLWAGCEFNAFREIRRQARAVWKLPRERHMVTAYWRRGVAGVVEEEPHHTSA